MTDDQAQPQFITVDEAAKILDVNPETIRRLLRQGDLKGEKTLVGQWKVDYQFLLKMKENYRI